MDAGIELIRLRKQKADVFLALPDIPLPSDTIVLSDKPVVDSPTAIKHTPLSPFIIDETAERIIVIHSYSSNLFIACRPLLRILLDESIEQLSKKASKSSYRRMFKWDQWGPENTFWLRMQPLSPGYVAVNGGRFCSLVETVHPVFITNKDIRNGDKERELSTENATEDGDEAVDSLVVGIRKTPMEPYLQWGKSILILDFNPRPILHAASKKEEIDESVKHEEKSEGGRWSWFRKRTQVGKWGSESSKSNESKISGLPFRAYQKPMRSRYNNMVLCTDHILRVTTCKRFQHLLKHSTLLQLVVELAVHGLRLRTNTNLKDDDGSSVDILNAFKRSQEAWRKLEPFKTATIPLSKYEYEIYGHLFAHGLVSNTGNFRGIEFNDLKIDCEAEPRSAPVWKRVEDIGIDILDYSYDVANDLLVIVENISDNMFHDRTRVFLMTISDGGPHPQANTTCLSFKHLPFQCSIKVVDNYLAISFLGVTNLPNTQNETLIIWNWKTGIMCYERANVFGYAFLSSDALALVVPIPKNRSTMIAGIELLHLGKQNPDVFLALPDTLPPSEIVVLSDKPTMDSPTLLKNAPQSPFVIDETAERIIVIDSASSHLFIACRPLLRILLDESIKPISKRPFKLPYPRAFKWHQWGLENTFCLPMQPISPGFVAVNGGRFCSLVEQSQPIFITNKDIRNGDKKGKLPAAKSTEDEDEELDSLVVGIRETPHVLYEGWSMLILDFNPRPILRSTSKRREIDELAKGAEKSEGGWWTRFRNRTKIGKWGSESSKIDELKMGGLSFRAYQRPMQREYNNMILSVNHVIRVATTPEAVPIWKRIEDTGIDILDYSFDVANDLVVIVERPDRNISSDLNRLLLVTISDGGPHPQAAKTYLSFKGAPILSHCTIKIVNGYLAISLRTRHTPYGPSKVIIIIWNWKTGTLCYERDDIVGYAFLSPDTLALVVPVVEDGSNRFVGIELLRIGKENADVFLALPYGEVPSEMFVLSDNLTVDSPTILGKMPLSPFVIDETAERIIVIHLENSQLFVACRPLIRILLDESIRPLSKKPYKLPYDRAFKWRQWGPDNTVWLRMQPLSPGFVAVSGGRFCSLVNSSQPIFITNKDVRNSDNKTNPHHDKAKEDGNDELDGLVLGIQDSALDQDAENAPWSILILDFNPRPILRAAFKREEADEAAKSVDDSENSWWRQSRKRKKAGKWGLGSSKLTEPKIGGLPFRAYQKPMQRRSFHMILTIDHILMIAEDQTGYEVLQFID
ncbi:hypothetical protein FRC16_001194 [Serendipita sp. 398]|nr:hypothetical protein FRC16_001194 [Serendipita sp. 398]